MFMGLSVDGFVARADDQLDFLGTNDGDAGVAQESFANFFATVDALVMGRRTFDVVHAFGESSWMYGDKPLILLSRTLTAVPAGARSSVRLGQGDPAAILAGLAAEGARHVYVDGAKTAQSFVQAGLITDIVVTLVPVLIGSGISAWGPLARDVRLELVSSTILGGAAPKLHYRVQPVDPPRS